MRRVPAPPRLRSLQEYGDRLGDVAFWTPYVHAVLARHRLPDAPVEAGFVGTYPTFLVGEVVVKLFGYFHSWRGDHATELAAQRLLAGKPEIPAPRLREHGHLYDESDCWPYLVTDRVAGQAWRDANLDPPGRLRVAERLGTAIRHLHDLPLPGTGPLARDWLRESGGRAAKRHRSWGTLPAAQCDQIDAYVSRTPTPAVRRVVHADLTADHIFVAGGRLTGIIDWGDAMTTDPYYDLGALHLGAFRAERPVLAAFLAGYGWEADDDFPQRAMSAALRHQFNLFDSTGLPLDTFDTLDQLAAALWDTGSRLA